MTHEHLSDEQLSAQLDGELHPARPGEPDAGPEAHLAACASCRRRRAALADARALVGTPVVPVTPSVKAAAVAAALAGGLPDERIAGRPPAVTALASRRPASRLLVGAAAAVALLVVGVGVSLGLTHGVAPSPTSGSATGVHRSAPTPPAASGTSAGIPALAPVSSPVALKAGLAPLLASRDDLQASGTMSSGSATQKSAAAPESPFGVANGVAGASTTCVAEAESAVGGTGTVTLVATTTYRHVPALVVVVREATTTVTPPDVAVVVARSGCRVLTRTTL